MNEIQYTIHAERESVCMGDDCKVPNASELPYKPDEMLSEWLDTVSKYVPAMRDTVWIVQDGAKILGYVIFDENRGHTCEIAVSDKLVSELQIKSLYCYRMRSSDLYDKLKERKINP